MAESRDIAGITATTNSNHPNSEKNAALTCPTTGMNAASSLIPFAGVQLFRQIRTDEV